MILSHKKIIVYFLGLFISISLGADQKNVKIKFEKFFKKIRAQKISVMGEENELLLIHSKKILPLIKSNYSSEDLKKIEDVIRPATEIRVQNGLVQASDRPLNSMDDPTHYDAIWVRDTLWVYLGLQAQGKNDEAKNVLLKILDYMSSADQLARLKNIISDPALVDKPDGAMRVVHIRFDGKSPEFKDVQINGKSQKWNHKQNDALGLFFDLVLRAVQEKIISPQELSSKQCEALALFPAYFSRIKFYEMEDAGSWEEIEKRATSSVGLVTSSLETLAQVMEGNSPTEKDLASKLNKAAKDLDVKKFLEAGAIHKLIDKGYNRISKQLKSGGESPLYPTNDPRFRKADAALLNLIYPARLPKLSMGQKKQVLEIVKSLAGGVGIKRYFNDSYQSGNFWFPLLDNQEAGNTDDTSSAEKFAARGKKFIEGSEAQWFFDSWYSICAGLMGQSKDEIYYFNRALAQITGEKAFSADGNKVKSFALPESYNTLVLAKERLFAPSPITPLNWSKASLSIALEELKKRIL